VQPFNQSIAVAVPDDEKSPGLFFIVQKVLVVVRVRRINREKVTNVEGTCENHAIV
jgi:hypothetical protein